MGMVADGTRYLMKDVRAKFSWGYFLFKCLSFAVGWDRQFLDGFGVR